jgi:hypothetical protein
MRPITRETIHVDRRQPVLRWSAVFAGAATTIALWVLLQMVGMGIGLAAVNVDDSGSLHDVGIGSTLWTLIAPLIAMFVGGFVSGRLAGAWSRGIGAMHGFVTWAISSVLGLLVTIGIVTIIASGALHSGAVAFDVTGANAFASPSSTPAQAAAAATGAVLLAAGISLAASLIVSLLGGALGVPHLRRAKLEREAEVEVRLPAAPPDAPNETTVPVVPR